MAEFKRSSNIKYIAKVVAEFQSKQNHRMHVNHLKYLVFVLHNGLAAHLKGAKISVVDLVLGCSDIIKETGSMRELFKDKERVELALLVGAINAPDDVDFQYKVPYRFKDMTAFYDHKKHCLDNKVTAAAIELVTSIYRIWCQAGCPNNTEYWKRQDKLTLDINTAFVLLQKGAISQKVYMDTVCGAYKAKLSLDK